MAVNFKKPKMHPVLQLPTVAQMEAMGKQRTLEFLNRREELIRLEQEDPMRHGWEPPIWKVCDALLGFEQPRYEWGVEADWAARMRRHLGFEHAIDVLLINGCQRGGKSEYAAKRGVQVLAHRPKQSAWFMHSKAQMSIDYQQPLIWKYLPKEWRIEAKTQTTYISYKAKTGFSDDSLILPNVSRGRFFNYTMDVRTIEGGNLDFIWPDELVPPDWVETCEFRIAERDGKMIVTFTPKEGYTFTVRMFQEGAETVKYATGFALPRDGGKPDVARALGLTEEEFLELSTAHRQKREARCVWSRPQDCNAWLEGGTGQPEIPAGRVFERLPRVMKPNPATDPMGIRAVVFFHLGDNPFGNPLSVWGKAAGKSEDDIKMRCYGLASKLESLKFPKFGEAHLVDADAIPSSGTNYMVMDPAGGRNAFMLWLRVTKDGIWVYREWPGNYPVPQHGVPGAWAIPDGVKVDGRAGPAQAGFGFGYCEYKRELARLEGWRQFRQGMPKDRSMPEMDWLAGLTEAEATERIERRFVDSRFASKPNAERDRPTTLLEEFRKIHVFFEPIASDNIDEGIEMINNALAYDVNAPVTYFNQPKLKVSRACQNLIFAMSVWTNTDGQKAATKDPIDCLRYFFLANCGLVTEEMWETEDDYDGGGYY